MQIKLRPIVGLCKMKSVSDSLLAGKWIIIPQGVGREPFEDRGKVNRCLLKVMQVRQPCLYESTSALFFDSPAFYSASFPDRQHGYCEWHQWAYSLSI